MSEPTLTLDETIASSVKQHIQAMIVKALSGDEVVAQMVAAALNRTIEVKRGGYKTEKTTFLDETIRATFESAARAAIQEVVSEQREQIVKATKAALRAKIGEMAEASVGQIERAVKGGYGVSVDVKVGGRDE